MAAVAHTTRNDFSFPPKGRRVPLDKVPPKIRRWLAQCDRSRDPALTTYVPGYFETEGK